MKFRKMPALAGVLMLVASPALADWAAIGGGQNRNGDISFFIAKSAGRTGPSYSVMEQCKGAGLRNCKVIAGFMDPDCLAAVASRERNIFTGVTHEAALAACRTAGNSCTPNSPRAGVCAGEE